MHQSFVARPVSGIQRYACLLYTSNLVGHPSWEPYVLHSNEAMFPVERAIVEGRGARSEQILRDKNGKEIPVLVHTAPVSYTHLVRPL